MLTDPLAARQGWPKASLLLCRLEDSRACTECGVISMEIVIGKLASGHMLEAL